MADEEEDGTCNQSNELSEEVSDKYPVHTKSITLIGISRPLIAFLGGDDLSFVSSRRSE